MIILGDVLIIEIGDPKIEDNCKNEGEIEDRKIDPVAGRANFKLDCPVEADNINRLYDKVEGK
jgi:hypothetical protein